MALYEKRHKMPPYLAEIPYGFKSLWQITVSAFDLQSETFLASNITDIILNGAAVEAFKLPELYDFNRDIASLVQSGGESGILVTLAKYDKETSTYTFDTLIEQDLSIAGVTSVIGDMVDNSNPQAPVINHDTQKLDVSTYNTDKTALDARLTADEAALGSMAQDVTLIKANAIIGATVNGDTAIVTNNILELEIAALTPEELEARLATKVDKTVAGVGGTIVESLDDSFDETTQTLTLAKTLLSLETGDVQVTSTSYDLGELLGITDLEAIDKELFYFCADSAVTTFTAPVSIAYTSLYRNNDDGSRYTPTSADNIQMIYALADNYVAVNVLGSPFVSAIGTKISRGGNNIIVSFVNTQRFTRYNQYNGYRANTIVYDPTTNALYNTVQEVPRPTSTGAIIPISNSTYYNPLLDNSLMTPNTIFANFEDTPNPGQDYTVDQTRIELMRGETREYAGYNEYIDFKTNTIPSQILNDTDWNNYINLWVTDGIVFTSLEDLTNYISNYTAPFRYKLSNRGIVRSQAENGGVTIQPLFYMDYIVNQLASVYIPIVSSAVSNNIAVFNNLGRVADSGASISDFATAEQGALADTAIQSVALRSGTAQGSVTLTVDSNDTEVQVTGLGTAAFHPDTDFATASQGAKADSAVQSVTLSTGTNNGSMAITVNGTKTDNVPVKGLGSAAYQQSSAFATAAQGAKADSAVQTVSIAPGTGNGSIQLTVNGVATTANVTGLGSAAYQPTTAFATSTQGGLADTALQPEDVIDNLTSTETQLPGSANQLRILSQQIESIAASGRYVGGFATYADVYTNNSQFPSDLQPIAANDYIYVASDENNGNQPAQYRASSVDGSGNITWVFVKLVADPARDFTLSPIIETEIADGAVTVQKIADNSVTTAKIVSGAVTTSKLSQSVQASLARADNSIQSPLFSDTSGNVVSAINETANNTLDIIYDTVVKSVNVVGSGDFVDNASVANGVLTLTKEGTALNDVQSEEGGNVVTALSVDGKTINVSRGTMLANVGTPTGNGNTLTGITTSGATIIPQLATRLASISKSGTGNVISGVSTSGTGVVTLTSDTMLKSLTITGTGNNIADISAANGVITATRGTAITSLPTASTAQAGIVQLNDTLTSSSVSQALTANQGRQLQANITAIDNGAVHREGSETIPGTKTFEAHLIIPAKTTLPATPLTTQYATEAQVGTRYAKITNPVTGNLVTIGPNGTLADSGITPATLATTTDISNVNVAIASKQNTITASGMLKGNDGGSVTAAVAGTDYVAPSALADYMSKLVNIITLTANTTLSATHAGAYIRCNNTASINITVPNTTAIPERTQITVFSANSGAVNFVASGVTINSADGKLAIDGQFKGVTLIKVSSTAWDLVGAVA